MRYPCLFAVATAEAGRDITTHARCFVARARTRHHTQDGKTPLALAEKSVRDSALRASLRIELKAQQQQQQRGLPPGGGAARSRSLGGGSKPPASPPLPLSPSSRLATPGERAVSADTTDCPERTALYPCVSCGERFPAALGLLCPGAGRGKNGTSCAVPRRAATGAPMGT